MSSIRKPPRNLGTQVKRYTSLSLSRYLTELSSKKPVPGGGSASAYAACLGIGLAEMVAQIGMKKVDGPTQASLKKTIFLLQKAKKDALQIVDLDPKVYQNVLKSYAKAKKISEKDRKEQFIDEALGNSFRLQADLALLVTMAVEAVHSLEGAVSGSISNDLRVSRALLKAAFQGAYDTAEINRIFMKNPQRKERAAHALEEVKKRFEASHV